METNTIENNTEKAQEQLTKIITDIIAIVEVESMYLIQGTLHHSYTCQINIILKLSTKESITCLLPVIQKVFSNQDTFSFRVFSFAYAQEQLLEGNLYFLNNCHPDNLVYQTNHENFIWSYPKRVSRDLIEKIKQNFKRDMSSMKSFISGMHYFRKENKLTQSAFMIHQSFEQGYRILERFVSGRIKVCHSIKNHQAYVLKSLKDLESMFDVTSTAEMELLDLLEEAYTKARYCPNYKITEKQLDQLHYKLGIFVKEISFHFHREITIFKEVLLEETIASYSNRCSENPLEDSLYKRHPKGSSLKTNSKKIKKVKRLLKSISQVETISASNDKIKTLSFHVIDHEDITGSISSLLEVCYYSLDGQGSFVSPKHKNKTPISSVAKVLEIVIDLLPHHQMFCLDKITEIVADENKKER